MLYPLIWDPITCVEICVYLKLRAIYTIIIFFEQRLSLFVCQIHLKIGWLIIVHFKLK